jgi:hypothetical protein
MRILAALLLIAACHKDDNKSIDAAVHVFQDAPKQIDAPKPIDAPTDSPPDGASMDIVTACDHACGALFACLMMQPDPGCTMGCQTDLADCTAQQVQTIDACSSQECGDIENNMSPLIDCIAAVPCVDMGGGGMLANLRK